MHLIISIYVLIATHPICYFLVGGKNGLSKMPQLWTGNSEKERLVFTVDDLNRPSEIIVSSLKSAFAPSHTSNWWTTTVYLGF